MPDGIWSGTQGSETVKESGLERFRNLTVNCGTRLNVGWNAIDASGLASLNPNNIAAGSVNAATPRGFEGAPHFIMSPRPAGSPNTFGFEFVLNLYGISGADQAAPGTGGYTVTIWQLLENTYTSDGSFAPAWGSFLAQTAVGLNEVWHSFDCNASQLRFQIGNLALDPATNSRSIGIAFREL